MVCQARIATAFYKKHLYRQQQADIGKKQAKCKEHPEAEHSVF